MRWKRKREFGVTRLPRFFFRVRTASARLGNAVINGITDGSAILLAGARLLPL